MTMLTTVMSPFLSDTFVNEFSSLIRSTFFKETVAILLRIMYSKVSTHCGTDRLNLNNLQPHSLVTIPRGEHHLHLMR